MLKFKSDWLTFYIKSNLFELRFEATWWWPVWVRFTAIGTPPSRAVPFWLVWFVNEDSLWSRYGLNDPEGSPLVTICGCWCCWLCSCCIESVRLDIGTVCCCCTRWWCWRWCCWWATAPYRGPVSLSFRRSRCSWCCCCWWTFRCGWE